MKVFLAGDVPWRDIGLYDDIIKKYHPFILESFFYVDEDTPRLMPHYGDFLLDSGAFTFMQSTKHHTNWDEWLDRYGEFIKRYKVEKFFELDIDSVVGYEQVLKYRQTLEQQTGRQCIPVWHNNRGKDAFIRMCQEYPYVAIGGLVGGNVEYSRQYWKYFPWFIETAHKYGAKIHALGFTSIDGIKKYHFDSVDSTAWTTGNRFGHVYKFSGDDIKIIHSPKGKRLGDYKRAAVINYTEWIKFQQYAFTHL